MDERYREQYYRLEEIHWWGVSRRDVILRLVEAAGIPKDARVLDVGCSSGPLVQQLTRAGYHDVQGVDVSDRAVEACLAKGLRARRMDASQLDFPDASFDLLIASDIAEHVAQDERALRDWRRVLAPEGKLLIFVPAFRFLWSGHDVINEHQRRYSKRELAQLLGVTGFEVERLSYWNTALFFPVAALRLARNLPLFGKDGAVHEIEEGHPVTTRLLTGLLGLENRWLAGFGNAPVGLSLFALAHPKR